MKYFIIEGILKDKNPIDENTMKEHIAYSKKAMDEGLIIQYNLNRVIELKLLLYFYVKKLALYT